MARKRLASARRRKAPVRLRVARRPARSPGLAKRQVPPREAPHETPILVATPSAAEPRPAPVEHRYTIPTGYGDDRIVLMVKDPWWLYAYWEIQPSTERAARSQLLPKEVAGLQSILRVYDVTGLEGSVQPRHRLMDISLSGLATNWYLHTNAPNRSFIVDIGILTQHGRFIILARSNRVTTPRCGPSEVIDERWMATDEIFWQLVGSSSALKSGSSSAGITELLAPRVFSPGWSSASAQHLAKPPVLRGFWCRVDTELVLYGAVESKATVRVQGQPIPVRKDGTFSIRLALPEGTQTIAVEAVSADGRQTRTITPVITRRTADVPSSVGDPPSALKQRAPSLGGVEEGPIA